MSLIIQVNLDLVVPIFKYQSIEYGTVKFSHSRALSSISWIFQLKILSWASVFLEKGITEVWLAEKPGKSYNMVKGSVQNRKQPRLEVLNEIATILDVAIRDLIVSNK